MKTVDKEDKVLYSRIKWLIELRIVLVSALLGLPLLFQLDTFENPWSIRTFYFIIGSTYCLTIFYLFTLKVRKPSLYFVSFQLGVDLFFETILIAVTGGLGSLFPFLYIITIVAAAIFFHQRGGLFMAGTASTLFIVMTFLQQNQILSLETVNPIGGKEMVYALFLYMIAFFTVGILSGRLSNRLHEKEVGLMDLRVFHEDIVQSISSGLITTDLNGIITSINHSATKITGYPSERVIGKSWEETFSWTEMETYFLKLDETGSSQRFEGEIINQYGERCLLGVTLSSLRNEQGKQTGIIGTFQDLTKIRGLEEEMQKKDRLAALGEMAAGMAHEIRNPLASLSGSIQVLKNELNLSGENLQLMEIAVKETERLNTFVTDFLRFARPLPPKREWVNLQKLLSDTLRLIRNNPETPSRVNVILEEFKEPIVIFADPSQLKQVLWNLANNALQAMPSGGILTFSARRVASQGEEAYAQILIKDTGEGILEHDIRKIFNPFFTTKSTGSGLGLAIVQRVVEEHYGQISVKSRSGKTVFKIVLPIDAADAWEPTQAAEPFGPDQATQQDNMHDFVSTKR
ncbi:PAS domain S-box protein [Nitrospira defluvii]|nr:PAS domain S-box protein [Nitrospira defluvii]